MQDNYVGDIGDYGKYGLLKAVCAEGITLSVNWYRVIPKHISKQEDGKYTSYLSMPRQYRVYDPVLFDSLGQMIEVEHDRRIARIEQESLFQATYFSEAIGVDRGKWHKQALRKTQFSETVFLDPDNGLETVTMYRTNSATEKHVKWMELKDYYTRGQNVILYQHRPQMISKEKCIEGILYFQDTCLMADAMKVLEFPKYTNRFYFIFLHKNYETAFAKICHTMAKKWGANDFCREITIRLRYSD